jgi:hypothetical protein
MKDAATLLYTGILGIKNDLNIKLLCNTGAIY